MHSPSDPVAPVATRPRARRRVDPLATTDLRRTRLRSVSEALEDLARYLEPEDRELVLAVYCQGIPATRLAALRARNESARTIRRRVRALAQRALSPRFEFVVLSRDSWDPLRRKVATRCILEGRAQRDAARDLNTSLYTVRAHLHAIEALMHRPARRAPRSAPVASPLREERAA